MRQLARALRECLVIVGRIAKRNPFRLYAMTGYGLARIGGEPMRRRIERWVEEASR